MNKELKPCPFCGGEAKIIHANDVALPYRIRCKNINCDVRPSTTWFKHEEDAIAKWNTRKPMDDIAGQLEKQKDEVFEFSVIENPNETHPCEYMIINDLLFGVYRGLQAAIEAVRKGGQE